MESSSSKAFFLGNNAALDFANTQFIQRGEEVDLLEEATDLVRWANQSGRSLASLPSVEELNDAKKLRRALRDLFQAVIDESSVTANSLKVVNHHLRELASHETLRVNASDQLELIADDSAVSVTSMLAVLAHEGANLLASPHAARVKRCNNPDCILLFLDTSRSKKRRWCSMDTCGNRAKAARHYHGQNQ